MHHKVTTIYGGIIVEVEHDLFANGLKGMDAKEAEEFSKGLDKLSHDICSALIRLNENKSASR